MADYLTKVLLFTIRSERFDLLVGYQPLVDEVEHAFEPGPNGGSREAVVRAFRTADRSAAAILSALTPRDSFLFFSDHGIVPLETGVNLEKYLADRGWTPVGPKGPAGRRAARPGVRDERNRARVPRSRPRAAPSARPPRPPSSRISADSAR